MDINLEYIKAIVSNHEGVDVEFKETTGQLNRGMGTNRILKTTDNHIIDL